VLRALKVCLIWGLLVAGVAGCGSGSDRPGAAASGTPTGSTSAVPSPAPSQLTGPAVAKFGQEKVQAAYREMVKFSFEAGWNPALIAKHVDQITRADFAGVLSYMTPACASTFDAAFVKVAQHDKKAIRTLEGAIFFGVRGPNGLAPTGSGRLVTDRKYSQVAVGLDTSHGVQRLSVAFTATANIQLRDAAGKAWLLPTSRKVRYLLVPNTGADIATKPFLIAGWLNKMTASHVKPVT